MLPLFLNIIGILLTAIVLFAGYSWMNSSELQNTAAAIELSDRLRGLQATSARYYYARGSYPRNLSDLAGETELPSMAGTDAVLELDSNIACISMTDTANHAHLLGIVAARVPGAVQANHCGSASSSGLIYVGVSIDGIAVP